MKVDPVTIRRAAEESTFSSQVMEKVVRLGAGPMRPLGQCRPAERAHIRARLPNRECEQVRRRSEVPFLWNLLYVIFTEYKYN